MERNLPISQIHEKTISATTDRLLSLDILKGLAAIAVIVNHISWIGINKSIFLYRFWVSPAVPVFVVITSFLYSRTFKKIGFDSWYSKENFRHFAKRFGPAALLILVLQFFIEVVRHSIPVSEFIRMILIGGLYGPGGYYVSILLQFICIFPFFFKLSYQKPLLGFVLIVFLSILYEIIPATILTNSLYRILIFRYSVAIYLGVILYFHFDRLKKTIIPTIALSSGIFFLVLGDVGYTYTVLNRWRESSSIFAGLYSFAIVFYFIKNEFAFNCKSYFFNAFRQLAILGFSSYHIFLSQMFYFLYFHRHIKNILEITITSANKKMIIFFLEWIISVSVCCIAGIIWFKLENIFFKCFVNIFRKNDI